MTDVLFYHLTSSPLERGLPDLLERAVARGWRVRVRGQNRDRLEHLDRHLWTYKDEGFLPHGLSGGPHDQAQPVLLSDTDDNANDAQVLMLVDGAQEPLTGFESYERVCVIFDGTNADTLEATREYWREVKSTAHDAKYWAQEDGRWVQKG